MIGAVGQRNARRQPDRAQHRGHQQRVARQRPAHFGRHVKRMGFLLQAHLDQDQAQREEQADRQDAGDQRRGEPGRAKRRKREGKPI
jgi:hypothetical protein